MNARWRLARVASVETSVLRLSLWSRCDSRSLTRFVFAWLGVRSVRASLVRAWRSSLARSVLSGSARLMRSLLHSPRFAHLRVVRTRIAREQLTSALAVRSRVAVVSRLVHPAPRWRARRSRRCCVVAWHGSVIATSSSASRASWWTTLASAVVEVAAIELAVVAPLVASVTANEVAQLRSVVTPPPPSAKQTASVLTTTQQR